tara:strand:+ start:499 stop:1248 length:750 start_codon:yes stop_codon:yes gene_type:complete
MRFIFLLLFLIAFKSEGQKITYTLVALCDNEFQGIVPVPKSIGNGDNPNTNLYWGCGYGLKTFFKKSSEWKLIKSQKIDTIILERLIFYNQKHDVYHIADAYRGREIKKCNVDFFKAVAGKINNQVKINDSLYINTNQATLINYIGHNGLMDFKMDFYPIRTDSLERKTSILACMSSQYYNVGVKISKSKPYVWTTNYMAPEAYTLHAIIKSWMNNQTGYQAREAAAQAYNKYQKCGINGARNLFKTDF